MSFSCKLFVLHPRIHYLNNHRLFHHSVTLSLIVFFLVRLIDYETNFTGTRRFSIRWAFKRPQKYLAFKQFAIQFNSISVTYH